MPVIDYMRGQFGVDFVDLVTEPGPNKILSENRDKTTVNSIKDRVRISLERHDSNLIAIVGHYDCIMLFKELYELWKGDNSLTQAVNDSHRMLEQTLEMFRESVRSLRQSDDGNLKLNVYESDQAVNEYMHQVRRKVHMYLAVTGGLNIIPGLILTSIVIDIERIGDYTKNITDLAVAHPRRLSGGNFEEDFQKIEQTVADIFHKLIPILNTSDKGAASGLINDTYWVLKRCDEIVDSVIKDEDKGHSSKDAATRVLYTRHLKRIAAHLLNIASSVVNPFEHIGFKSEDGSTVSSS